MRIVRPRVEGSFDQLAVDTPAPAFSWAYAGDGPDEHQGSYRITVAESPAQLDAGELVLDSGVVESPATIAVTVPGDDLRPVTRYAWRLETWDRAGRTTTPVVAEFVTSKLGDPWLGSWIGDGTASPLYLRTEWRAAQPIAAAYAQVSGVGHFVFHVNGARVGDHELDPGWTDYHRRVQYVTFDVTDLLRAGDNALGLELAGGWYAAESGGRYFDFTLLDEAGEAIEPAPENRYRPFGPSLAAIVDVHVRYADGSRAVITSGGDWRTRRSATTLASIQGSEDFDARRFPLGWTEAGFDDSGWMPAVPTPTGDRPRGRLAPQSQPPVVVKRVHEPVSVTRFGAESSALYDFGQNAAGMLELTVRGRSGQTVEMHVAEKLTADGRIDQSVDFGGLRFAPTTVFSRYTLRGDDGGETWRQTFGYWGGRYVRVDWEPGDDAPEILALRSRAISTAGRVTGELRTDDPRIDGVLRIVTESIDSNLQSVHTDCPHIEKGAWLEVSHLLAPSVMYHRDAGDLWAKILDDIRDAQYHEGEPAEPVRLGGPAYHREGFIPSKAPSWSAAITASPMGDFWDIPPWGSTIVLAARWHYRYYGDRTVLAANVEAGLDYVRYLRSRLTPEGFLQHGLGDWGNPDQSSLAKANIETAVLYEDLVVLADLARELGRDDDARGLEADAAALAENYSARLLARNPVSGLWGYVSQPDPDPGFQAETEARLDPAVRDAAEPRMSLGSQALPLALGMVPAERRADVEATLLRSLERGGFLVGELTLPYLLRALTAMGREDAIVDFVRGDEHPSYWRFVANGETTLPEFWQDDARSRNHDMLGHIVEWFYAGMAGLTPTGPGFATFRVEPSLPATVSTLECGFDSVRGRIGISLERGDGTTRVTVDVPPNTTASGAFGRLGRTVTVDGITSDAGSEVAFRPGRTEVLVTA